MIWNIIGGIITIAIGLWLMRWVLLQTIAAFRSVFGRQR